jgi:hypothetical protein
MDITSPARLVLSCKKCKVTFVPESKHQVMCTNCTITEEITAKMKARQKNEAR